jgi:hypothetical protein
MSSPGIDPRQNRRFAATWRSQAANSFFGGNKGLQLENLAETHSPMAIFAPVLAGPRPVIELGTEFRKSRWVEVDAGRRLFLSKRGHRLDRSGPPRGNERRNASNKQQQKPDTGIRPGVYWLHLIQEASH